MPDPAAALDSKTIACRLGQCWKGPTAGPTFCQVAPGPEIGSCARLQSTNKKAAREGRRKYSR